MPRRRKLFASELDFLARELGQSLDPQTITLAGGGHPFGRHAWQPIGSFIQMHDSCFEGGDPARPLRVDAYPVFAHEALHIWQRKHHHCRVNVSVDGLWLGVTQGRRAYRYDASIEDPEAMLACFLKGNIEQQGQIWQDYVQSDIEDHARRAPKFLLIAHYVKTFGG